MYVIYDKDGVIDQTIIGPDETYGAVLDKAGHNWLFLEGVGQIDLRLVHVDPTEKVIKSNAEMPIIATKTRIAADGNDVSLISGIPANSTAQILCDGHLHNVETITDGQIEFTTATPATYTFRLSSKRYLPAQIEVLAS